MDSLGCWNDSAVEGFFRVHYKMLEAILGCNNSDITEVLELFKWGDYRLF